MIITSGFFADWVGIYASKLFVQGGVWDHFVVSELPTDAMIPMALILQVGPGDRDREHVLDVAFSKDGVETPCMQGRLVPPPDMEHWSFALTVPVRFTTAGRHVCMLSLDGQPGYAIPLDVRLT